MLQHGLGGEPRHERGNGVGAERAAGTDRLGVRFLDGAGKDGEPGPEQALGGGAELVAPADGGAQGPVALGPYGPVGEEIEPGPEPVGDLLDAVLREPGAGQFEGERNSLQPAADPDGCRGGAGGVERDMRRGGSGAVAEEPHGLLAVTARSQRGYVQAVFAAHAERLSAGGEDGQSRCGSQEFAHQVAARVDDPLAAVQDEQQIPVGEPLAERLHGARQVVVQEPDGIGDGADEQSVVVEMGQVGPPHAVGVPLARPVGGAKSQPALADSATARERDQPVFLKCPCRIAQFADSADETGRHDGKIAHHAYILDPSRSKADTRGEERPELADSECQVFKKRHVLALCGDISS